MEPFDTASALIRWTARALAFQAGKLPADKVTWKPAPDCKSTLDVMNECISVMLMEMPVFSGGQMEQMDFVKTETLQEATRLLIETADRYGDALEKVQPGELDRPLYMPWATLQASRSVFYAIIELAHHHGQVAYIQSLAGDKEVHFDVECLEKYWGVPGQERPEPATQA